MFLLIKDTVANVKQLRPVLQNLKGFSILLKIKQTILCGVRICHRKAEMYIEMYLHFNATVTTNKHKYICTYTYIYTYSIYICVCCVHVRMCVILLDVGYYIYIFLI